MGIAIEAVVSKADSLRIYNQKNKNNKNNKEWSLTHTHTYIYSRTYR